MNIRCGVFLVMLRYIDSNVFVCLNQGKLTRNPQYCIYRKKYTTEEIKANELMFFLEMLVTIALQIKFSGFCAYSFFQTLN